MEEMNSVDICRNVCKSKCCRSTPPALTSEDIDKIKKRDNINIEEAIESAKKKEIFFVVSKKEGSHNCYFLSDEGECTIYADRPLDCKLFPILFKIKTYEREKYRIRWYVWYCPLTERKGIDTLLSDAKQIIKEYLPKKSHILFEYQSAMYVSGGYKRKHFIKEEIL